MKKLFSLLLVIFVMLSMVFPVSALNSTISTPSKSITVLNLDDNSIQNNDTLKKLANTSSAANDVDVINLSSDKINQIDTASLFNIVDNGAILVVQNTSNINTCEEMANYLKINTSNIYADIVDDNVLILGYEIHKNTSDYSIAPIFATVLKPENDDDFDIKGELENLKACDTIYVDPMDVYQRVQAQTHDEVSATASPQYNFDFDYDQSGYGYLYGKNGNAVWGKKDGYQVFAFVKKYVTVKRNCIKNGYAYDTVESHFTITGQNNKYVKSYKVANNVGKSYTSMPGYLYVNEHTKAIFSVEFSITDKGPITKNAVTIDYNPDKQTISTTVTNKKVLWNVSPNSHIKNASWRFNGSCLLSTPRGKDSILWVGVEELVVDNALLKYSITTPLVLTVNIKK